MDAKSRYRHRLKLQAALARVLETLSANAQDGIPADRTTAQMAYPVVLHLLRFIEDAGSPDPEPGISRFIKCILQRQSQTKLRYRRRHRR